MRKSKLILFIIIAIFVLLVLIGLVSFYPVLSMNPVETGQVFNTEILAVKNGMNSSFLIKAKNGDGYILFDAGSNAKKFETSLSKIEITASDIKWIFLSHSDSDHVGALTLFQDAQIYMNKDELQMINGDTKRNQFGENSLPPGIDIDKITLLSDGQELFPGETIIKCIAAPGHTPGSMLYLIDGKYLFTGDAFKINNSSLSVHPFTMDESQSKQTILNLSEFVSNASVVLTSHFGARIR